MFNKILIANRGEIACRVIKTARLMGIKTVAIYSDADTHALHVKMADEAVHIGQSPAKDSYLVIEKVMEAVRKTGADAVHPGYGFLSENKMFAEALKVEGVTFIGTSAKAIESMGDKIKSKKLAQKAGVNTIPGFMGIISDVEEAVKISNQIGYPVMLKTSAGGGGKGMRISSNDEETREGFRSSKNEALNSFGDDRIFIEKFIQQPRHIEIQVLADSHGNCIYLNERECSIQRRNQKVIEEAPSPFLTSKIRQLMGNQSCALAKSVGYISAGTVEFIVDKDQNFYFLEMNTRLQVEHPVTELITGIDLVEQMIRAANGEILSISQKDVVINGWAIESRLYAEDPYRQFLPSTGRLKKYSPPTEIRSDVAVVRNDTGVYEGGEISIYYDPMIAKLCTWSQTREGAISNMRHALDGFEIEGIGHNIPFLSAVMDHPRFCSGNITTAFIEEEYPEGFLGVELSIAALKEVAACAVAMYRLGEIRRTRVSGRMDNHTRRVRDDWVVNLQENEFPVKIDADPNGSTVHFKDCSHRVSSDWTPGKSIALMNVDGKDMLLKVEKRTSGFRVRFRGADILVSVRSPRQNELAGLMLKKEVADTSKLLLCPMPGLITTVEVNAGDEVQEGQALCTIEAMKMENILRAERRSIVKKVNVAPNSSLSVDEIIMEFE